MDLSKIDNVVVNDINLSDAPDYVDAFIYAADYDGKPMTDRQIEEINENREFVYEQVIKHLY